jgi:hypothetical protein
MIFYCLICGCRVSFNARECPECGSGILANFHHIFILLKRKLFGWHPSPRLERSGPRRVFSRNDCSIDRTEISEFIHQVNAIRAREYENSADKVMDLSSGFPLILNPSPLPSNFAQYEKNNELTALYKKYGGHPAFILRPQMLR